MLEILMAITIWCAIYGGFAYFMEEILVPFCKFIWRLIQEYRGKA